MSALPYFQSIIQPLNLLQTQWRSILNPVLALPLLQGIQLTQVKLISGANVINTQLQRNQQGWFLTDIDADVTVYRSAPFNNLTLTLTASGACIVSIWVY